MRSIDADELKRQAEILCDYCMETDLYKYNMCKSGKALYICNKKIVDWIADSAKTEKEVIPIEWLEAERELLLKKNNTVYDLKATTIDDVIEKWRTQNEL